MNILFDLRHPSVRLRYPRPQCMTCQTYLQNCCFEQPLFEARSTKLCYARYPLPRPSPQLPPHSSIPNPTRTTSSPSSHPSPSPHTAPSYAPNQHPSPSHTSKPQLTSSPPPCHPSPRVDLKTPRSIQCALAEFPQSHLVELPVLRDYKPDGSGDDMSRRLLRSS